MTLNRELLTLTLKHIEAFPEEWDQGQWRRTAYEAMKSYAIPAYNCHTVMCFAGWACQLNGDQWEDSRGYSSLVISDVGTIHARDRAEAILGLTENQADSLFSAKNTIEDLRWIVAGLLAKDDIEG